MKRTTTPWLRLEPVLRRSVEEVLRDGESLSGFVDSAWRAQIPQKQQAAFRAVNYPAVLGRLLVAPFTKILHRGRNPMLSRVTAVLLFSLTLITSGCGASTMTTLDIKPNPNAKQRYEITITVHGAPRGFDTAEGTMIYEVQNSSTCVRPDAFSGHQSNLAKFIPFELKRVDDHTYKGTVVTDYFLDADYDGMGVCHWIMSSAMVSFKIKGNGTNFAPSIRLSDVQAQKSVDLYLPIVALSNDNAQTFGDGGLELSDTIKKHRSEFFVITLSSKKVMR